jgi:hypothetical protein
MKCKAQTTLKVLPKYDSTEHSASALKNNEKSTIRRLVNVKLDYSMDNCE